MKIIITIGILAVVMLVIAMPTVRAFTGTQAEQEQINKMTESLQQTSQSLHDYITEIKTCKKLANEVSDPAVLQCIAKVRGKSVEDAAKLMGVTK